MSKFGKDLIEAMGEALAHAEGAKTGVVGKSAKLDMLLPLSGGGWVGVPNQKARAVKLGVPAWEATKPMSPQITPT